MQLEKKMTKPWMIREVIAKESVTAHYQPIISLKRKALIGFEGLSRGVHPESRVLLPPLDLFSEASRADLTLKLDRLCQKKVLEQFKPIHEAHPDMMLNLNFDASVIDEGEVGSENLLQTVNRLGYQPSNICLEIIESNAENMEELQKFVDNCRGHGFLIALDDVGAGHSNLNRIPLLKPDILKIDRYLIQGIQDNFYKQQIFKSLVFMARTLGTLIVAEGVETREEALTVLEMGADMIQGYYFAKPIEPQQCTAESHQEKINDLILGVKMSDIQKVGAKRIHYAKHHSMIGEIQSELSKATFLDFDGRMERIASRFPNAECFYVLNDLGIQVTETFVNDAGSFHRNKSLFHPAPKGTDHTMKDFYYMLIEGGLEKTTFVTEPYLSMASGNMCVTISALFNDALQKKHLLCVDIKVQNLSP
jgi:EAL domain-containing protein (putative c-di-GMP-specific phosphodiesterase class I)